MKGFSLKLIKPLKDWYGELNLLFPNRVDVINAALFCLVSKHNLLLIGSSGAGKTKLLETILDSLYCDDIFYFQANKACRREEIIGMFNPKRFRESGEFIVDSTGYLPEAKYAMLDEFLSLNGYTSRVTLGIIHPYEHMLRLGNEVRKCPLETCFATSNFFAPPEEDRDMDAVYARFACIMHVDGSIRREDRLKVYDSYRVEMDNYLPEDVLAPIQEAAKHVIVPQPVKHKLADYQELVSNDIREVSLRTECFTLDLARAAAAVKGKTEVTIDDLDQVVPYTFSLTAEDPMKIASRLALEE